MQTDHPDLDSNEYNVDRYLDAFTTATKYKSSERIYLDAFAGEGRGLSRTTGKEFESSPRIALNVDDPPFTRLRFFELGRTATRLRQELEADFPGRDFKVVAGDCNETIPEVLANSTGSTSGGRRRPRSSTPTVWS